MADVPGNTPVKVDSSITEAAIDRFRFGRLFEALLGSENNLFG